MELGTQWQLDTFLLETQVSTGIGNMKETSETWGKHQKHGRTMEK